jgi:hypothetical protein
MKAVEYKCEICADRCEMPQEHSGPPPVCASCDENLPPETPYMSRVLQLEGQA